MHMSMYIGKSHMYIVCCTLYFCKESLQIKEKCIFFFYKLPQTFKRLERIYLNTILLDNFLTKFLNCYEFVSSTYLTVVYSTI